MTQIDSTALALPYSRVMRIVIRDSELAHYGIPVTPVETPADLPIGE